MKNANSILKYDGILIVDDTNVDYIDDEVNSYLKLGNYTEINILETTAYKHRILRKTPG
jgi:hypothetical protein